VPDPERILVAVSLLAARDHRRFDPDSVLPGQIGSTVVAASLAVLPALAEPSADTVAARLWAALDTRGEQPTPGRLAALDAALVLMADHELSSAALAARVAASAHADPYQVVLAGVATLAGTLHAAAGEVAETVVDSICELDDPEQVVELHRDSTGHLPGFGHPVYRGGDPRAEHLFGLLPRVSRDRVLTDRVQALREHAADARLPA